jgi:hypothetical protein
MPSFNLSVVLHFVYLANLIKYIRRKKIATAQILVFNKRQMCSRIPNLNICSLNIIHFLNVTKQNKVDVELIGEFGYFSRYQKRQQTAAPSHWTSASPDLLSR